MPAYFISLREGLEAALIVGILLGTLRRLDQRSLGRYVWLGVIAASGVSLVVAVGLSAAGIEFEGRGEQLFEGVMFISAAGLLTGMIFWMQRRSGQLRTALEAGTRRAVASAKSEGTKGAFPPGAWALFTVAFVAVVREGIELALLLVATTFGASPASTAAGGLLGIASAVFVGVLLYGGVLKLNLGHFFRVTNVLLLLFAAGMVGLGAHELIEAGVLPAIVNPLWNINAVLSDSSTFGELLKGLFGYRGSPALTEVMAYTGYLALIGWALARARRSLALRS